MKQTSAYLIAILFFAQTVSAQDTINLNEITFKKKVNYKKLLKKIKSSMESKVDTNTTLFHIDQISTINNELLLSLNDTLTLKINSFANKFEKKYKKSVIEYVQNINNTKFKNYIENSTPIGWISNYPVRKNLNTVNLDFFSNYKDYQYCVYNIDLTHNKLTFKSQCNYKGEIIYDRKTFKPQKIIYESISPYNFSHSSSQNLKTSANFKSTWTYLFEKVEIIFTDVNTTLGLLSIDIAEKIQDFSYERYDKKGTIIYSDKNDFETILKLKR